MTAAQQAGVLCSDPAFQKFLHDDKRCQAVRGPSDAAEFVREWCGVVSRSVIDQFPFAIDRWHSLVSDYRAWQRAPEYV
jgi:hypothetical protein